MGKHQYGFAVFEGILIILIVATLIVSGIFIWHKHQSYPASQTIAATAGQWSFGAQALMGDNYAADPDVVALGNGQYRMYYGQSPQKPGAGPNHPILSAFSTNGKTFRPEAGIRIANGAFPDVIHLKNGGWKMYYQGSGGIVSASSINGLSWQQDPGIRIDTSNPNHLNLYQVGAPTIMQERNGTFVMVYAGYINTKYNGSVPNQDTHLFLWATSSDGLNFTIQCIALDSRNNTYQGWLDGPEWVNWNGTWRMFYWGYAGIYFDTFNGHSFSKGQLAYKGQGASNNPMAQYSPHPPGDPTVININKIWYLYYDMTNNSGQDVIYYATQQ